MGFFSDIGNAVGNVFSGGNVVRGIEAGLTGGLSEFTRSDPFGVSKNYLPIVAGTGLGIATGNPMMGMTAGMQLSGAMQSADAVRQANELNYAMAEQQMSFSAQQAAQQQAFQERMSNTSVSRMKEDMLNAGINPMLAAGSGESTPSGAAGSSAGARFEPIPSVALSMANSAKDLMSTYAQFKSSMASADAASAQAKKAGVETSILENKKPLSDIEGKFFGWLNKAFDDVSSVTAKGVRRFKESRSSIAPQDVQIEQ